MAISPAAAIQECSDVDYNTKLFMNISEIFQPATTLRLPHILLRSMDFQLKTNWQ
ncbi:unnamed protein product [Arabidopsis halleri]